MECKIYQSRISPVLWSITWFIIIGVFYLTIMPVVEHPKLHDIVILLVLWIPILVFLLIVMLGMRYIIKSKELIIKIGPIIERKIPIQDILSLHRSYNLISSPASSLKRLKVKYKKGEVLISPTNEKEFIGFLKSINPTIKTE